MWALKQGAEVSGTLREMRKKVTTPKTQTYPKVGGRLDGGGGAACGRLQKFRACSRARACAGRVHAGGEKRRAHEMQ